MKILYGQTFVQDAALAPGLVYGEFHVMCPMYVAVKPKKTYSLYAFRFLVCAKDFSRVLPTALNISFPVHRFEYEQETVEFDYPDRFGR